MRGVRTLQYLLSQGHSYDMLLVYYHDDHDDNTVGLNFLFQCITLLCIALQCWALYFICSLQPFLLLFNVLQYL